MNIPQAMVLSRFGSVFHAHPAIPRLAADDWHHGSGLVDVKLLARLPSFEESFFEISLFDDRLR